MLQDSSVIMRQARGRLVIQADILSKKMLLIFSSKIKSFNTPLGSDQGSRIVWAVVLIYYQETPG